MRASASDIDILKTPRGVRIDTLDAPTTPRKSSPRPVDVPMDLGAYQRKRFEAVSRNGGNMTQDVVQMLHSIIRNAMYSGQSNTRLQTFRLARDFQYRYTEKTQTAHAVHDAHTLIEIKGTRARVSFSTHTSDFFQWLQREGVHFLCTTQVMRNKVTFGELPLADFVHVQALFIPEDTDLRERQGQVLSLWNTVYTAKCLDNSMVQQWNQRALAAVRIGGTHFVVCTLYAESDYTTTTGKAESDEFKVVEPRNHLTMVPLMPTPKWTLDKKFAYLIGWVAQLGYQWTLTCGYHTQETRCSSWAYFTVLLDPLERYE